MPLRIGHDDGLEERLHHGIAELMLHLQTAGLCLAQIAQPNDHSVDLGADGAEVILRSPFDALLQVSLSDAFGRAGSVANGSRHEVRHEAADENAGDDAGSACADEPRAEPRLTALDVCHHHIVTELEGFESRIQIAADLFELIDELLGRHESLQNLLMAGLQVVDRDPGIEGGDQRSGGCKQILRLRSLRFELPVFRCSSRKPRGGHLLCRHRRSCGGQRGERFVGMVV